MEKRSRALSIHDETPPPKKRRLHPSWFESSFGVTASPSKPPRHTMAIQSILSTTPHEFTSFENEGREQDGTPVRCLKPPRLALDDNPSEVYTASEDKNSPAHHLHSHRRKRISASFSDFTSTFDMPPRPSTSKPRSELLPSKIAHFTHQISTPQLFCVRTIETGSVVSTPITPRTQMNLLKPPSLREAVESQNHSPSRIHSPPSANFPHLLGITSNPDTDKLKLSSMTSHLSTLKGAISNVASPKRIATEVNRKLIPIAPLTLAPGSPTDVNQATATVMSFTVSHTERAEILANSVRMSRTHQPANAELAELSRGLELSPQKDGRGHGKKLIKGGLAERAERLLFRSRTSFSLWQAGLTKQLKGAKHTKEDMRLRISSILSYTKRTTSSFLDGLPRTTITKCTEVLQGAPEGNENSPKEGTVVFLFANHEMISSAANFKEGEEVCVWRPWQEIELPEVFDRFQFPALELRTSSTPGESTVGRRTALLCSRFLVSV